VIGWFAENRSFIAGHSDLAKTIRALPIWPSGGELRSLDELSVPGGFEDRLKLARILDPHISSSWSSFLLEDLGARKLDLGTYLAEHVPRAFESDPLPGSETRRALLRLLVDHSGDLLDDESLPRALKHLPIVNARTGSFIPSRNVFQKYPRAGRVRPNRAPLPSLLSSGKWLREMCWRGWGLAAFQGLMTYWRGVASLTEQGPVFAAARRHSEPVQGAGRKLG